MEHRWGERIGIDVPVQLRCLSGVVSAGSITNASFTGAFIRTNILPPLMARIDILVDAHPLPAFVARTAPEGIGVEWCSPLPQIIYSLLLTANSSGFSADHDNGPADFPALDAKPFEA